MINDIGIDVRYSLRESEIARLKARIALLDEAVLNLKTLVEYAYGEGWDDGCCYDDTNDFGIPSTGGIAADWAESNTKKLLQEDKPHE